AFVTLIVESRNEVSARAAGCRLSPQKNGTAQPLARRAGTFTTHVEPWFVHRIEPFEPERISTSQKISRAGFSDTPVSPVTVHERASLPHPKPRALLDDGPTPL